MVKTAGIMIDARVDRIQQPDTLRFSQLVAGQKHVCQSVACCEDFFSFGRAESPFPVPDDIRVEISGKSCPGTLADPAGLPELREAVSGFYARNYNITADADRIIIGHGVKGLVLPIFTILAGSVIVPSPGWLGYLPQLRILNKPYYRLYGHYAAQYKIRPTQLAAMLKGLVKSQHLLILNNPGYPTGNLYTEKDLKEIAAICRESNTLILANEAYSLLTYDLSKFVSMGSIYPEGTFVLNGLSMDRSAGGLRIGTCILPEGSDQALKDELIKVLATVYTAAVTPVQQAAIPAYLPNPAMDAYLHDTREIHRIMTTRLAARCAAIEGVRTIIPEGGFSFMVDLNVMIAEIRAAGIQYSNDLAPAMIQHPYHIATVTGEAMMAGYDDFYIRFSATDYDGTAALESYRSVPPKTPSDEEAFFMRHGARMAAGIEMFSRWVSDVRSGSFKFEKSAE
ncbi:pyridoxal phosphate-dependent aminotransferase [uncultured Methanospirillum sp.]|uniref:pyridoxal phosphate-dependent aminotransferase n=1 Tax=uncultured Methanospirillum sp. TaxID=262503 RepID=UPI00374A6F06